MILLIFCCDYGYYIYIGDYIFVNFDCVILDVCEVCIGYYCLIVSGVYIYMVGYFFDLIERKFGLEFGKFVIIGDYVWIGGWVVINLGVMIGDNVVIVLGFVVIKDVFVNIVVGGNFVRMLKEL